MSEIRHERPGVYSSYDASAVITSGRGGKIRTACRKYLREQAESGRIRLVIRGEDFSIFSEVTRRSFILCGELRHDRDLDRENRGVTFVVF